MDFNDRSSKVISGINILILSVLLMWPIFLTWFLLVNRKKLENEKFKKKYSSMYSGIKTDKYLGTNLGSR